MALKPVIVMAFVISVMLFISMPGVIWTFPSSNLVSSTDPTKLNKLNAVTVSIIMGFLISFSWPIIWEIINKN